MHGGFLQSWLSGGLNTAVLRRVRQIVQECSCAREDFKLYATGDPQEMYAAETSLFGLAFIDGSREVQTDMGLCNT